MLKLNANEIDLIKKSLTHRKKQITDHAKETDKLNDLHKIVNSQIIYLKSKQKRKLIGCVSDYLEDKEITSKSENKLWSIFESLQEKLADKPKKVAPKLNEKKEEPL